MSKIILFFIFSVFLNASNPKPYAVLGDVIYENAQNIEKLQYINSCKLNRQEIKNYIKSVNETRQYGFDLENKKVNKDKKVYLNKLRKLSKINDQYLRDAKVVYKMSMKEKNYELFFDVINSGLIDIETKKDEIINYYYSNKGCIETKGVIEKLLDEDAKLRALREARRKSYKTKKELELERIKRIRENDKLAKIKLEEELQKDLNQKKLEIRKNQEKELSY